MRQLRQDSEIDSLCRGANNSNYSHCWLLPQARIDTSLIAMIKRSLLTVTNNEAIIQLMIITPLNDKLTPTCCTT